MTCPTCGTDNLKRARREEVEIDVCLNCGGVWLDRGELETIIERTDCDDKQPTNSNNDRFRRWRRAYDGDFSGTL